MPRAQAWRLLGVLAAAQFAVALVARYILWPPQGLAGWRTLYYFLHWDMLAIGALMAAAAGALLLAERWPVFRRVVLVAAWVATAAHCLLLAANVTAIYWLRVPVTWQWLYFADLGRTQTPLAVAASVVTPATALGIAAASVAPFLFWQIAKRAVRFAPLQRERALSLGLIAALLALPLIRSSDPPIRDRWRDAVSNPGLAMARSLLSDGTARLERIEGDGRQGDYIALPRREASEPAGENTPDIVLVVLESVGRDHILDNRAVLPTLDRLIARGTHYPNAGVTNSNSVRSIFELYFSRFPVVGYQPETYLFDRIDAPAVPAAMEQIGYRSALFMASDLGYQDARAFLQRHGVTGLNDIDRIACENRLVLSTRRWQNNDYLPDSCVFDAAQNWLLQPGKPAFATVWTGPTHFPYIPPAGTSEGDPGKRHLLALQETDRVLGNFLVQLREAGRDPMVLVVGDHGEAFGLHGTNVHGYSIYEDETAIPFIASGPGIAEGKQDPRLVSLADIGPTLTDYAGGPRPAGWQGISVLGERQRTRHFRFALLDAPIVGYRDAQRKYVLDLREDSAAIYDLEADPDELSPRPASPAERRQIERAVAGWMRYNRSLNEGG